jgi:hypothetical protein
MRIDSKTFAAPASIAATQRREAPGRAFTLDARGAAPAKAGSVGAAAPLATLDALLALQGEDGPAERRRRSIRRGHDLLDALDRLKAALLSGRVPTADLAAVAARLAERRDLTDDPRLDDVLSHIELRARVEMAKLGVV